MLTVNQDHWLQVADHGVFCEPEQFIRIVFCLIGLARPGGSSAPDRVERWDSWVEENVSDITCRVRLSRVLVRIVGFVLVGVVIGLRGPRTHEPHSHAELPQRVATDRAFG